MADPSLAQVRLSELPDVASLKVNVDQQRLAALGLLARRRQLDALDAPGAGATSTTSSIAGRVKRVYVQGDAQYRSVPSDLGQWSVRNSSGTMVGFSRPSLRPGGA